MSQLEVRAIDADHFDLLREPAVAHVTEHVRAWLARLDRTATGDATAASSSGAR
jgi:thioesterase domain-containing protein